MSLINQEITYIASTNIGASCVLYEFSVSPLTGVAVNTGFASLNNPSNTNNTLKLNFSVAGTYTVNVVARSSCSAGTSFTSSIVQVVGNTATNCDPIPNSNSGFRMLTPPSTTLANGIDYLNQNGTVQYNQLNIVYNGDGTITDLDWNVNNYGLPKAWRFDKEDFRTIPLINVPLETWRHGRQTTIEVHYYLNGVPSNYEKRFQQSFIFN